MLIDIARPELYYKGMSFVAGEGNAQGWADFHTDWTCVDPVDPIEPFEPLAELEPPDLFIQEAHPVIDSRTREELFMERCLQLFPMPWMKDMFRYEPAALGPHLREMCRGDIDPADIVVALSGTDDVMYRSVQERASALAQKRQLYAEWQAIYGQSDAS